MARVVDDLVDVEEPEPRHVQTCLLEKLTARRIRDTLAAPDLPAGQAPQAFEGRATALDEEHPVATQDDGTCAERGAVRQARRTAVPQAVTISMPPSLPTVS